MNILGIIPAREGSKRVPEKNFRRFLGTTLTDLAIKQALGSKLLTQIVLSSDSEAVLAIGRKYQQITCLQRPSEISGDDAAAIEYVRHALSELESGQDAFDMVVILQPSSPLRTSEDTDATIQLLLDNPSADSAVSVAKLDHMVHPLKLKTLEGNALKPYLEDEAGRFAAQDLPDVYVRNGAVYATWRRDLETRPDVIGQKSLAYLMPRERSVDINDWVDLEFAAYLYKKQRLTLLLPSVSE
jgi:CMP-N-acetylneuraminic acid synthetase